MVLVLAQAVVGCASVQVRPTPLANVHKVAIVAFGWSVDLSSESDKNLSNPVGDAIGTSKAISALAKGAPAADQPAVTAYGAFGKKLEEDLHWTVIPLQDLSANPALQQAITSHRRMGDNYAIPGIMHPLHADRLNAAQRKELMTALGVDALVIADVKIKVGGTSGFAMGGMGKITKYPQATIALTAYGAQDAEPMWQDRWAAGEKSKTGIANTMGVVNDSTNDTALAEATASGLDRLIARYREQSGPVASK
jgi:hypothetical protein